VRLAETVAGLTNGTQHYWRSSHRTKPEQATSCPSAGAQCFINPRQQLLQTHNKF